MKTNFSIILFWLCLNMGFFFVNNVVMMPSLEAGQDVTGDVEGAIGDKWSPPKPTGVSWIDIPQFLMWAATIFLDVVLGVVAGFPLFLLQLGAPAVIVVPICIPLYLYMIAFLVELWTGRAVSD